MAKKRRRDHSWMDTANCRGVDPSWFHPTAPWEEESPIETWPHWEDIVPLCAECVHKDECLDYALSLPHDEDGFWGGLTKSQRARLSSQIYGDPFDIVAINDASTLLADQSVYA